MNTGQIIKAKGENQFTKIANSVIQNQNISMQAKGLFCYLQSLPANWVINKSELPDHFTNGYDGIITAFNELESLELILSVEIRDAAGKFKGFNYICYPEPIREIPDQPIREKPISEKPISGNPIRENPDLQRNILTKIQFNKKTSNKEIFDDSEKSSVIPFWRQLVGVWKSYYKKKKGDSPTFNGAEGKHLKQLIFKIQKKISGAGLEWNETSASDGLRIILESIKDKWILDNLDIKLVNSKFDIIYARAKSKSPEALNAELDAQIEARIGKQQQTADSWVP